MPYERRSYGLQWVDDLPRIPAMITNSIVYLYPDRDLAETGAETGASGFLVGERSAVSGAKSPFVRDNPALVNDVRTAMREDFKAAYESGDHQRARAVANSKDQLENHLQHCSHIYVITNKHVIEGKHSSPVVRMNLRHPDSGFERTLVLDFKQSDWVTDPSNDLAVCMLSPDFNPTVVEFSVITRDFLMTEKECREQDIGPGDDVVYVGRFVGHAGKWENMPSVRFGNISMNPNEREPIEYDTDNARMSQVGFLVEARSRSGYSGSPVFTLNQHVVNNKRAVLPWMDMRLLGVDWGHLPERIPLRDPQGYLHGSRWYVEVHAGMMGVVPAWRLLSFIDTAPRLIERRKQDDAWYASIPLNGVPDVLLGEDERANAKT